MTPGMGCANRKNDRVMKVILTFKQLGWYVHILAYRSFATRVSQLKIWHFWVIGIERNVCRCTFQRVQCHNAVRKNSPLENSCVVIALVENYSISKPLNVFPEKSQILSCDTVVTNKRHVLWIKHVLFEQEKKDKIRNKWRFVENKTRIMWPVLKLRSIFLLPKYIKTDFEGCFFNKCLRMWMWIV